MFIYHVQGTASGYDTYDSFVCAAASADDARRTHPSGGYSWDDTRRSWSPNPWSDEWDASIDTVTVILIGEAVPGVEAGVICASYNAG